MQRNELPPEILINRSEMSFTEHERELEKLVKEKLIAIYEEAFPLSRVVKSSCLPPDKQPAEIAAKCIKLDKHTNGRIKLPPIENLSQGGPNSQKKAEKLRLAIDYLRSTPGLTIEDNVDGSRYVRVSGLADRNLVLDKLNTMPAIEVLEKYNNQIIKLLSCLRGMEEPGENSIYKDVKWLSHSLCRVSPSSASTNRRMLAAGSYLIFNENLEGIPREMHQKNLQEENNWLSYKANVSKIALGLSYLLEKSGLPYNYGYPDNRVGSAWQISLSNNQSQNSLEKLSQLAEEIESEKPIAEDKKAKNKKHVPALKLKLNSRKWKFWAHYRQYNLQKARLYFQLIEDNEDNPDIKNFHQTSIAELKNIFEERKVPYQQFIQHINFDFNSSSASLQHQITGARSDIESYLNNSKSLDTLATENQSKPDYLMHFHYGLLCLANLHLQSLSALLRPGVDSLPEGSLRVNVEKELRKFDNYYHKFIQTNQQGALPQEQAQPAFSISTDSISTQLSNLYTQHAERLHATLNMLTKYLPEGHNKENRQKGIWNTLNENFKNSTRLGITAVSINKWYSEVREKFFELHGFYLHLGEVPELTMVPSVPESRRHSPDSLQQEGFDDIAQNTIQPQCAPSAVKFEKYLKIVLNKQTILPEPYMAKLEPIIRNKSNTIAGVLNAYDAQLQAFFNQQEARKDQLEKIIWSEVYDPSLNDGWKLTQTIDVEMDERNQPKFKLTVLKKVDEKKVCCHVEMTAEEFKQRLGNVKLEIGGQNSLAALINPPQAADTEDITSAPISKLQLTRENFPDIKRLLPEVLDFAANNRDKRQIKAEDGSEIEIQFLNKKATASITDPQYFVDVETKREKNRGLLKKFKAISRPTNLDNEEEISKNFIDKIDEIEKELWDTAHIKRAGLLYYWGFAEEKLVNLTGWTSLRNISYTLFRTRAEKKIEDKLQQIASRIVY